MASLTRKSAAPLARMATLVATATLGVGLLGCATSSTSQLDKSFGDSVRAIRDQQIIAPSPSQRQDPVAGLDGVAAVHTQDRYRESFKQPPKTFEMLSSGGAGQ